MSAAPTRAEPSRAGPRGRSGGVCYKAGMSGDEPQDAPGGADDPPLVEVVIEIPRWSLLKRGSTGRIDFVSPLPCPYNYGSVPSHLGLEGDLLDALVLGPRLPRGTRLRVPVRGAVGLTDRGLYRTGDGGDTFARVDVEWPAAFRDRTTQGLAVVDDAA